MEVVMRSIQVSKNEAGQRLDKLLLKYLNLAPKSFLYKMLRKKNIVLNGKKAEGAEKTQEGDEIKVFLSETAILEFSSVWKSSDQKSFEVLAVPLEDEKSKLGLAEYAQEQTKKNGWGTSGNLEVLYEDNNILILNKPAGMLSQKSCPSDISAVEVLIDYLLSTGAVMKDELAGFRPGICNRLDRNTSGILIGGKSLLGLQEMSVLFRERSIQKYYQCIVKGKQQIVGRIEGYLKKDETLNEVKIVQQETKDSSYFAAEYRILKQTEQYTLLEVNLITGKTHQIRAHLQSIGFPVIGDIKYGDENVNRVIRERFRLKHQLLHAGRIVFPKMQGEFEAISGKEFIAPLPLAFQRIQSALFNHRKNVPIL